MYQYFDTRKYIPIANHCRTLADYGVCPFWECQCFRHFDGLVTKHQSQVDILLKKFRLRSECNLQ